MELDVYCALMYSLCAFVIFLLTKTAVSLGKKLVDFFPQRQWLQGISAKTLRD